MAGRRAVLGRQMKPGKPLTFATLEVGKDGRKMLVFGLPGELSSGGVD